MRTIHGCCKATSSNKGTALAQAGQCSETNRMKTGRGVFSTRWKSSALEIVRVAAPMVISCR
jgi:hypothetical protein